MDVIQRVEPVIIELERERESVLVVAHQVGATTSNWARLCIAGLGGPEARMVEKEGVLGMTDACEMTQSKANPTR
jgi:hypothetical protein